MNSSRPKCVDEVAFQEEVVAVLKKSLEGADVSNIWLVFFGGGWAVIALAALLHLVC